MCVCVCVCACVCVCNYFFHFVSCSVFLTDLVTSVLLPYSCLVNVCKMLNKNQKLVIITLFFFCTPPHPLVIIMIIYYDYYYYMQRLKESCNFVASVPGLPCAQKVEEKEGEKKEK